MYRTPSKRRKKYKRTLWLFTALILLAIGTGPLVYRSVLNRSMYDTASANNHPATTKHVAQTARELIGLQPVVDAWVARQQNGQYGIVVYDLANRRAIAVHGADTKFATASIYKLYAVYMALEDVDAGKHTLGEDFAFGKTRQACIHDAIQLSDNPCGDALVNELGPTTLTRRLGAIGLTGTSFPQYVTTPQDSILILRRLYERRDLSESSTNLLLDAMKTQVYRDGLPKGMQGAVVADKVGFTETPYYHDVGIVTLPNGRDYLVAFFSKGVESDATADFGATIYQVLDN